MKQINQNLRQDPKNYDKNVPLDCRNTQVEYKQLRPTLEGVRSDLTLD